VDRDGSYAIGELARRTGLSVKAIRFYSDRGIVPPAGRSAAGHRRYGCDAVARLDLVRSLRGLGVDLDTIRRVLDRELSLADVAAAQAEALSVRIRVLRLRRAALMAIAERGYSLEETDMVQNVAGIAGQEHRRLVGEFLDVVFGADPAYAGVRCSMTPDLPADPDAAQVDAWLELAELLRDPDFRDGMRRMAELYAADHAPGEAPPRRDAIALVRDYAAAPAGAGVDPASPGAGAVVAAATAAYAAAVGRPDGPALRRRLQARLETASDPRREQYLRLLAVVNGWPPGPSLLPALDWFARASDSRAA
jgi:DNA-binding transcriptional MerR regulator